MAFCFQLDERQLPVSPLYITELNNKKKSTIINISLYCILIYTKYELIMDIYVYTHTVYVYIYLRMNININIYIYIYILLFFSGDNIYIYILKKKIL